MPRQGINRITAMICRASALAAAMLLAGCGGGGTVSTPPPPVATPPTPSPSPLPTPSPAPASGFPVASVPVQFDTVEFRRSDGPGQHNAQVAWADGWDGQGVTIAVVDTGIDPANPEFAGRISPLSADMYASRGSVTAISDHGTMVSLIAAAARNNSGILGMAWGSTVMALRADTPGSCSPAGTTISSSDCTFTDGAIADAVNYAAGNGARVINISLGGTGGISTGLRNAVQNAVAAGALVVVAAGNDGLAHLDQFDLEMDAAGNGGVLIVGSIDKNYQISSFSNQAGSDQAHYIAARGENVCCTYRNGQIYVDSQGYEYLVSGTSFAAPQVAGAAALLAQAFPNLTGKQIADILLKSAYDAGAPGSDPVYGQGILDIARAFQPIGTTAVAGTGAVLSLGSTQATGSPAMGDALAHAASLVTIVTDAYGRAFDANLAPALQGAQPINRLYQAVGSQQRQVVAGNAHASIAFSIAGREDLPPIAGMLRLDPAQAHGARFLAARMAMQIAPGKSLGFAYGLNASGLVQQLQGDDRPAFMIAGGPAGDTGSIRAADASFAYRQQFGLWGLTLSAGTGRSYSGSPVWQADLMRGTMVEHPQTTAALALDRRFARLDTAFGFTWLAEDGTLLGAQFAPGFGLRGADSLFLDGSAAWHLAGKWRLGASFRQGWTRARGGGLVAGGSRLTSRAFAVDLERADMVVHGDALALRLSQPLRVASGQLNLLLPSSWSYATLSARYMMHSLQLEPSGREMIGELAWRGPLLGGSAAASLYYRTDPGNYSSLSDEKGVALRWSAGF